MAAVFFTSSEVVIYARFTRDGQNFKRRDKDDKVEGRGGGGIGCTSLPACYVNKCTAS